MESIRKIIREEFNNNLIDDINEFLELEFYHNVKY